MNVNKNSLRAWWLAARPKTLTGAAAPVLVGGAFAYAVTRHHALGISATLHTTSYIPTQLQHNMLTPFILCLLFALLMQINANFINDYFDFKKGTDRDDRLGPERACAQGWIAPEAMLWGILVTTALSCLTGIGIMMYHRQYELMAVGIMCVLGCFLYTTRLSYLGWGDVLVLLFFGIIPVTFTTYVVTGGHISLPVIIAGMAMGFATDNLLIVNNYRDRYQDELSGKRTIIVRIINRQKTRLGEEQGKTKGEHISLSLYLWFGIAAALLAVGILFILPGSAATGPLMIIYLLLHFRSFRQMSQLNGKALNKVLGATARNIFIFGLLLSAGIMISSLIHL